MAGWKCREIHTSRKKRVLGRTGVSGACIPSGSGSLGRTLEPGVRAGVRECVSEAYDDGGDAGAGHGGSGGDDAD